MARKAVLAAAAAGILALASGVWTLTAGADSKDGPVDLGNGASLATIVTDVPGQVAFSHNSAINRASEPVVLVSAQLLDPGGAHPRVTQSWAAPLGPDTSRYLATPWPADPPVDESGLSAVEGFIIPPGTSAYFIFLVDVESDGVWRWPGMVLTYVYDGTMYTERIDNEFQVCAPSTVDCASQ